MSSLLFFGDVVGEPGRVALMRALPELQREFKAVLTIVNAENAAGGRGITPKLAQELLRKGVDVITLGDHVWDQSDLAPWLHQEPRVLRPLNLQEGSPGHGSYVAETSLGKVGIISLEGRTFMRPSASNPFPAGMSEALRLRDEEGCLVQLVDIHAETTSEKIALGYHLDGHVSAVVGTHTHVQTADGRILEQGTAYLTDAGMCGTLNGVIGRDAEASVEGFVTGMPNKLPVGGWPVQICGVAIDIDWQRGKATSIQPFIRIYEKNT